ncbi:hypothetical protein GGS23DRAFT_568833, partial [Durotheca rogersii]|uniref:uncharacterized protein n=1 Tax=Durotheca rogersii TaxID=419775 RepID=UPI00221E9F2A
MPAVPTIRLTFLYPHLFRAARFGESSAQRAKLRCRKSSSSSKPPLAAATFSTSTSVKHAVFERHGTAVEPLPVPPAAAKTPPQGPTPVQPKPSNSASTNNKSATNQEKEVAPEPKNAEKAKTQEPAGNAAIPQAASSGSSSVNPQQVATEAKIQESGPMKAVLHTPPLESSHHPHLSTPPYVHHFDTYTLVKQLTDSGYTQAQAITAMKAIRVLLAQNMAVARDGLVSKSNVDNETYLFRAACSELSAEVKNNRRTADETTRQQRTQLQHEVDIVTQRMTQDLMTLKDDVKGMFNDRRMNVREEQRTMESAVRHHSTTSLFFFFSASLSHLA